MDISTAFQKPLAYFIIALVILKYSNTQVLDLEHIDLVLIQLLLMYFLCLQWCANCVFLKRVIVHSTENGLLHFCQLLSRLGSVYIVKQFQRVNWNNLDAQFKIPQKEKKNYLKRKKRCFVFVQDVYPFQKTFIYITLLNLRTILCLFKILTLSCEEIRDVE